VDHWDEEEEKKKKEKEKEENNVSIQCPLLRKSFIPNLFLLS